MVFGFGAIAQPDKYKYKQTRRNLNRTENLCGIVSGKKVKWLGHGTSLQASIVSLLTLLFKNTFHLSSLLPCCTKKLEIQTWFK